jgi:hypothetical protein
VARLSSTGSWAASPYRDREDFKKALLKLCPTHAFSDSAVQDFYGALSIVVGKWFSEQQRVEVSPVAKSLRSMGISFDEAARTLRGHQTGFHTNVEIEIVSQIKNYLALDPTIGSVEKADDLITPLQRDAVKLARACLVAASDLASQPAAPGRTRLGWHDAFTELLLKIAQTAGVVPTLGKDRIRGSGPAGCFGPHRILKASFGRKCDLQPPRRAGSVWSGARRGSPSGLDKTLPPAPPKLSM